MAIKTYGLMGVDWEERVNYERLRNERLARIKKLLKESEMGALLCFDMNNVRYITATHIGTWAMDKLARFSLLPQDDEPIMWDFGSAAGSDPAPVSQHCEAQSYPRLAGPKTWHARYALSWKNADCSTSRWEWTRLNCRCCSLYKPRASKWWMDSN